MGLAHDEIRDVLARAAKIDSTTPASYADLELVMQAAEEAGIARSAVERALRERLELPMKPPAAGELTFARSADGRFYVAEVVEAAPDGVRVRYLRGSEHTVAPDELRPCSFLPGERVICQWPWWGPWTCTVLSYDARKRRVTVTDGWGDTRDFPISDVWIAPRVAGASRRLAFQVAIIGFSATAGAAIGALLTAFILR